MTQLTNLGELAPLRLTREGLDLLLESDSVPFSRRELTDEQAEQWERLRAAGLLNTRGKVPWRARHVLAAIRTPEVAMEVYAMDGDTAVARWRANMQGDHALIWAPPSPVPDSTVTARQVADYLRNPPEEYYVQVVTKAWTPVAAFAWMGLCGRNAYAGDYRFPGEALARRLTDPDEPCPPGVPPTLWAEPLMFWYVVATPGEHCTYLLDSGASGLWEIEWEKGEVRLEPLPVYNAWLTLLEILQRAYQTLNTPTAQQ